ncbi:MAG: hypothetical protein Q9218_007244 [Villophora microphyllina]
MADPKQQPWSKLYPVEPVFIPALKVGAWSGGRKNIFPGIIMFSLFGFAGQHFYNTLDARRGPPIAPDGASTTGRGDSNTDQPVWKRALNSRWSPMKVLSDEEYEKMLKQKLLRVDAEIAILEENIAKAKMQVDAQNSLKNEKSGP